MKRCSEEDCDRTHYALSLCRLHWQRVYRKTKTAKYPKGTSKSSWLNMIARCTKPYATAYKDYGGRGITVCDEWLKFDNFLKDMGERPTGQTLERINNSLGYSPTNCRWADWTTQNINKKVYCNNKSGYTGVAFDKTVKKWRAYANVQGKRKYLGFFKEKQEAVSARKTVEETHYSALLASN